MSPRRGKSHLLPVNDRLREQVLYGRLQNVLSSEPLDRELGRNGRSKFDQYMVQKGNTALNRSRHAHLVLLHQQFNQVSFYIGIKQTRSEERRVGKECR